MTERAISSADLCTYARIIWPGTTKIKNGNTDWGGEYFYESATSYIPEDEA